MSAQRAPRVTIEPVGPADPDSFLAAIEQTLEAGDVDRESVVISVEEPAALPDYTMGSEAAQSGERPTGGEDDPEATDALDCGHAAVYAESGSCMVCEPAWRTAEDGEVYREQSPDVGHRGYL